jgi:very-short-patch-repair endonuclease/predicted transcriptional regulator of viral defense system
MGAKIRHSSKETVWVLASRQHGVISKGQLRALGLSDKAIRHRLARGRLHPVAWGVYAVGRPEVDRLGEWMAAVLACGPTAVLSHTSAGALWGIRGERGRAPIDVSVRTCSHREVEGVRLHRRGALRDRDVTEHQRIPVTTPAQTLIDLAVTLDARRLERAVNEADKLDLVDPATLLESLDGYTAREGVGRLRAMLGAQVFRLTDSELERRFLRLVRRAKVPMPQTGARLNGFKVDFFWPDLGLVVETDGLRYHRTPTQQVRDRERDQVHTAAGLTTLRFTHSQVVSDPLLVQRTLRRVVRRLEDSRRPAGRLAATRPAIARPA